MPLAPPAQRVTFRLAVFATASRGISRRTIFEKPVFGALSSIMPTSERAFYNVILAIISVSERPTKHATSRLSQANPVILFVGRDRYQSQQSVAPTRAKVRLISPSKQRRARGQRFVKGPQRPEDRGDLFAIQNRLWDLYSLRLAYCRARPPTPLAAKGKVKRLIRQ
jgi:hypothetical protein